MSLDSFDLVHISSLLLSDGDLIPDLLQVLHVDVLDEQLVGVSGLGQHLAERVDERGVPPRHVVRILVPGRAHRRHEHLVVERAAASQ